MLLVLPPIYIKTVLQQIRSLTGLNVIGKTRNIAFNLFSGTELFKAGLL